MQSPLVIAQQVAGNIEKTLAPLVIGVSTTETAFSNNGNPIANIPAAVLPISVGDQGVFVAGSYALSTLLSTGVPFRVRAFGYAKIASTNNVTIKLYVVPAASVAALTPTSLTGAVEIATTGAVSVAATTAAFELDATAQAVAVSGTSVSVTGQYAGNSNGTVVGPTTLASSVTGLQGESDLNFFATAQCGATGSAGDTIVLQQIDVETVA